MRQFFILMANASLLMRSNRMISTMWQVEEGGYQSIQSERCTNKNLRKSVSKEVQRAIVNQLWKVASTTGACLHSFERHVANQGYAEGRYMVKHIDLWAIDATKQRHGLQTHQHGIFIGFQKFSAEEWDFFGEFLMQTKQEDSSDMPSLTSWASIPPSSDILLDDAGCRHHPSSESKACLSP
jgi:predicted 2-oxoglutarate/Fe(II)-dependent dioxygenase YbiX